MLLLLYPILLEWAVKAMLLCAIAAGTITLARGISSATRHAIWTAAIAGFLLLPVAYFVLPAWRPPLSASVAGWLSSATPRPQHIQQSSPPNARMDQTLRPAGTARGIEFGIAVSSNSAPIFETGSALLLLWGIGTGLMLLWLCVGYGRLGNISRAAQEVTDPLWRIILADTAAEFGVRRDVRLRTSSDVSAPCLAGAFHPVILLPRDAADWPSEKRRLVLLHEFAHVRRHDRSTQFLAQFVCALLWFSPLHWYAAWRIRIERERACDDRVLASGISPVAYADVLLDVAKTFRFLRSIAPSVVAMARYANLEERLLAVLSEKADRRAVTSVHARLVVLTMLVLTVSLGAIRADDTGERQLMNDSFRASPTSSISGASRIGARTPETATVNVSGAHPRLSQDTRRRAFSLDSVYARVLPNDRATELVLTGRDIRYAFTIDGIKSMERQARERARTELPTFASEGISNMRIVFPLGHVHDVIFDGHTLTLQTEQKMVRHDGRNDRGVFAVDSVSDADAREFIKQFDLLKAH